MRKYAVGEARLSDHNIKHATVSPADKVTVQSMPLTSRRTRSFCLGRSKRSVGLSGCGTPTTVTKSLDLHDYHK